MSAALLLKWVNPVLFVSALLQALTGVALYFELVESSPKLFSYTLKIHAKNGLLLIILIAIHLALNWSWVKAQFFKKR